jgi:hypothetical protein
MPCKKILSNLKFTVDTAEMNEIFKCVEQEYEKDLTHLEETITSLVLENKRLQEKYDILAQTNSKA